MIECLRNLLRLLLMYEKELMQIINKNCFSLTFILSQLNTLSSDSNEEALITGENFEAEKDDVGFSDPEELDDLNWSSAWRDDDDDEDVDVIQLASKPAIIELEDGTEEVAKKKRKKKQKVNHEVTVE